MKVLKVITAITMFLLASNAYSALIHQSHNYSNTEYAAPLSPGETFYFNGFDGSLGVLDKVDVTYHIGTGFTLTLDLLPPDVTVTNRIAGIGSSTYLFRESTYYSHYDATGNTVSDAIAASNGAGGSASFIRDEYALDPSLSDFYASVISPTFAVTAGSSVNWNGCCNVTNAFANVSASIDMDYYYTPNVSAVPVPAAAWLFGSGLLGLIGFSKRKKAA